MKITIIGAGNVGGALAQQWAKKGHDIIVGARNPESDKVKKLKEQLPNLSITDVPGGVRTGEVILVATPPQFAVELTREWGAVAGKVIIDATNAIRLKPTPYATAFHAFEDLTKGAVVKCFNTTGFENMANPEYNLPGSADASICIDMFMAGDSAEGKEVAKQLAIDAGFEDCYDFGGSDKVELLEQFALSWINLAIFQGMGRQFAFKVLHR